MCLFATNRNIEPDIHICICYRDRNDISLQQNLVRTEIMLEQIIYVRTTIIIS